MIASRIIDALERRTGEDMTYGREIAREVPFGFWKFLLGGPLLQHQGSAPAELVHLARIGALGVEDCGPCLQMQVTEARKYGVDPGTLHSALAGGDGLSPPQKGALALGKVVADVRAPGPDPLTEPLQEAIGRAGVVDLTLAAAAVRIFPALKRGLGYARSCSEVRVEI